MTLSVSGCVALLGDANLDGVVDGQDFIIWNEHKFMGGTDFQTGDFNFDGITDGQDFILWNQNKFRSLEHGAMLVPEPGMAGSLAWLMIGGWIARLRRRGAIR